MNKGYTTVLTIAGSDSSGGAGIQADLKTFASLECFGLSVITAITAQNTSGVNAVYPLDEKCIRAQFRSISDDIAINAVKIGMLGTAETIRTVAALLRELKGNPPVILDTVLASSGGTHLLPYEAIPMFKEELFPLTTLITPNLPETALLTGMPHPPKSHEAIEEAAAKLLETGTASVLIKGGHGEEDECGDCLLYDSRIVWFSSKKIATGNTHGTGCTLSSAIAAFMARGESIESAVANAKEYINNALLAGAVYRLGHGNGPPHHFYRFWQ